MKKILGMVAALALAVPTGVMAEESAVLVKFSQQSKTCDTTHCTEVHEVSLYANTQDLSISGPMNATVTEKTNTEFLSAGGSSDFTVTTSGLVITYTHNDTMATVAQGDSITLGTIEYKYLNEEKEDCGLSLSFSFGSADIEVEEEDNPQTGISVPVIAVSTLGILGLGAYLVVRKNSKIYNV